MSPFCSTHASRPPRAPPGEHSCSGYKTQNELGLTDCLVARQQTRAAKGFLVLTLVFLVLFIPVERLATREANLVRLCRSSQLPRNRTDGDLSQAPAIARIRPLCPRAIEAKGLLLISRWFRHRHWPPRRLPVTCQSKMA